MSAVQEMKIYQTNLRTTIRDLGTISQKIDDLSVALKVSKVVVEGVDFAGDAAEQARKSIDNQLKILKVTKLAGPLKTPSKLFEKLLNGLRPVVEKIENGVDKLNGKQDNKTTGEEEDGEFLDKLSQALETASNALDETVEALDNQIYRLENTVGAIGEFIEAVETGLDPAHNALITALEAQIAARNADAFDLATSYTAVKNKFEGVVDMVSDAGFAGIQGDLGALVKVDGFFDAISGPLSVVASILKPVEPLLNAVGFFVDLILGPIFDFISKSLGVDKLMEKVTDQIKKLFPDGDFLEPLLEVAQSLLDDIREFNLNKFGLTAFQAEVEDFLFGSTTTVSGAVGVADDEDQTVLGSNEDNIIDARDGDDIILAGGGNDVIVAGAGDDVVNGGQGTDTIVFSGLLQEYELAKREDGRVIVTHMAPRDGRASEGSETLIDVEHVVFQNARFTGQQLEDAIIGGSVLDGTSADDLMFLNSSGTPNGDGQHVANGKGGDDVIYGSTGDDELNGDNGNDVLLGLDGDDELNGGNGNDTFHILEDGTNRRSYIDLTAGTSFGSDGQDTLNGIENLIVQNTGNHFLTGNEKANIIISATGKDVLTGLDGDDTLMGGDGRDYLIGGAGRDRMEGGKDRDVLVSHIAHRAGQGETHDGGSGFDLISYSGNYNYLRDFVSTDDPSVGNEIRNGLNESRTPGSIATGPLEIRAGVGVVKHLDANGDVVAVDRLNSIEQIIGSDSDDVIFGASGSYLDEVRIGGGDGDDLLYTNGANQTDGGDDDDRVVITQGEIGGRSGSSIVEGGGGHDILDMTALGDVRWRVYLEGSIGRSVTAYAADLDDRLLNASGHVFRANSYDFEEYLMGDFGNEVYHTTNSSIVRTFHSGSGDDFFDHRNGKIMVYAGGGDDEIRLQSDGSAYGQGGDDDILVRNADQGDVISGGGGNDLVIFERGEAQLLGNQGFDTLSFDVHTVTNGVIDLDAGTATGRHVASNGSVTSFDVTVAGFERIIGLDQSETIIGSFRDETLIGRGGNDTTLGGAGNDRIFGNAGDDSIDGGSGNDRIHGGVGNDAINGGSGDDTVLYTYSAPDGEEGLTSASGFGGVNIDLAAGTASGAFGNDSLSLIENVFGSAGNDTLSGDANRNTLAGEAGDDILNGMDGNDVLITGTGTDTANGGDGNDRIVVGDGIATVDGGVGSDRLELGMSSGQVTLDFAASTWAGTTIAARPVWADTGTTEARSYRGVMLTPDLVRQADPNFADSADDLTRDLPEEGDAEYATFLIEDESFDRVVSGSFTNFEVVAGISGAEVNIRLSGNRDVYDGRSTGNDLLDFSFAGGRINYNLSTGATNVGLARNDALLGIDGVRGGSNDDTLSGNKADNIFYGGDGRDLLVGKLGDDVLMGEDGKDKLVAGEGDDTIDGGNGDDVIEAGSGDDTVMGGVGDDVISGRLGRDTLEGGDGDDVLFGGGNADVMRGDGGDDRMRGGDGGDKMFGGDRADKMFGEAGADDMRGGDGEDQLRGGLGGDTLDGGKARDVLVGDQGNDTLTGGGGGDIFVFADGFGRDVITDFNAVSGAEKINLRDVSAITGMVDLNQNHLRQVGADTLIDAGGGNIIKLTGVQRSDLDASDFLF